MSRQLDPFASHFDSLDSIGGNAPGADDIRRVTRNPMVHAAIGAMAANAPLGTAAAAVAEAGMGLAELYAEYGDDISDAVQWGRRAVAKLNPFKKKRRGKLTPDEKRRAIAWAQHALTPPQLALQRELNESPEMQAAGALAYAVERGTPLAQAQSMAEQVRRAAARARVPVVASAPVAAAARELTARVVRRASAQGDGIRGLCVRAGRSDIQSGTWVQSSSGAPGWVVTPSKIVAGRWVRK